MRSTADTWDRHWRTRASGGSTFGFLASAVRRTILSRAVEAYAARWFTADGVYVEMGCGSAESSARLPRGAGRRYVALDFSRAALERARRSPAFAAWVQGDVFSLGFADGSLSGIWNLGVMEHFEEPEGLRILREFRRVLKPGGAAVLFWPPEFGSSRLALAPIEAVRSLGRREPFRFFPDEVNRVKSLRHARRMAEAAGLEPVAADFGPRDAFIHVVLVARRPVA